MKKIGLLLLFAFLFLAAYNIFLFAFPLKKNVYYTNAERIEEYVYTKTDYPIVLVGSSLSGAFEGKELFKEKYFNLYLHFNGGGTGIEVIRQSNKIPKKLFIEINYINRGVNASLTNYIFTPPFYNLRHYQPFLLTKNKLFPNLVDRIKRPSDNKLNKRRPPAKFYNELLRKAKTEWNTILDTSLLKTRLDFVKQAVAEFAARGCKIYFYEMPMDTSLTNGTLIDYERNYFTNLASLHGYTFIGRDKTRAYQTGDGVHLLKDDATIFTQYFKEELSKTKKTKL